jgi:predicted XRE-type DNA-binding protein
VRPSNCRVPTAFEELGFPAEEAEHLRIRADLMIALTRLIGDRRWAQPEAARRLGVAPPRVSDLVRGKIGGFSIDTLVTMLSHADADVTVRVRRCQSAV